MRKVTQSILFAGVVMCCVMLTECGSKDKATALDAQYPIDKSDTIVVELQEITDTKIVVYETEQVSVVLGYSGFVADLQAFIDRYNVPDDILLSDKLLNIASAADSINITALEVESGLIERFHYRLADILEKGAAAVYPKGSETPVKSIFVEHFEFIAHKMAGRGGRRFYLPDRTLFLEVLDWMS